MMQEPCKNPRNALQAEAVRKQNEGKVESPDFSHGEYVNATTTNICFKNKKMII
jgi:hypothetical protein